MSKTIDTHIHLTEFTPKELKILIEKRDKFVVISTDENNWDKAASLYDKFPEKIIPSFGLHPWYIKDASSKWAYKLESLLQKYPQSIVGEIGLDGIKDKEKEPQLAVFKTQIELAKKYNRPIIIHAVKCQDWLEEVWKFLPQKFAFHSYSGKEELLKKIIKFGGYVSFSPSIFKKEKNIISLVPNNRVLAETDAPYQGRFEDLELVISEIAKIKNISSDDIYNNTLEFITIDR